MGKKWRTRERKIEGKNQNERSKSFLSINHEMIVNNDLPE